MVTRKPCSIVAHFEDGKKVLMLTCPYHEAKAKLVGFRPVDFYPERPHRLIIETALPVKEAKRILAQAKRDNQYSGPVWRLWADEVREKVAALDKAYVSKMGRTRGLVGWY